MKYITTIILLFPCLLFGQITKDTVITISGNIYREVTTLEGEDIVIRRKYVGTTQDDAVVEILKAAESDIRLYARQAVTFATRNVRKELEPVQALVNAYTGKTWFQAMAARHGETIAGTYRYRKNNANEVQVTLSKPNATSIRMTHNGTNYNMRVVGREWIVILNFDGNTDLHLYWDGENGKYIDINNVYELRKL
jgi:hypothetical protein